MTTSYQLNRPSLAKKYEPRAQRLGYLAYALCTATFFSERLPFIFTVPRCFGLLPDTGLFILMPPLATLTLSTTIPCLALSPRALALSSLVGLAILTTLGPLLHAIILLLTSGERSFSSCWYV